jgi:hypothetical protein
MSAKRAKKGKVYQSAKACQCQGMLASSGCKKCACAKELTETNVKPEEKNLIN